MSRSDSTDPVLIQIWYSGRKVVVHDHRFGPCDAPRSLDIALTNPGTRCRWEYDALPARLCSCGHKHMAWWNRLDRTQSRRTAKARLGDARRLINAGLAAEDIDSV